MREHHSIKMNIRFWTCLILAVALLLLPACAEEQHSKSVEEAETYDDLLMEFDEDEDELEEDEDELLEDDEAEAEEEEEESEPDDSSESEDSKEPLGQSYEERYKHWKEHEKWRDKEVDKFKTAEEYAEYYHDDYIELFMEENLDDYHTYGESFMLDQAFLDAVYHWEVNQPWPKPKK